MRITEVSFDWNWFGDWHSYHKLRDWLFCKVADKCWKDGPFEFICVGPVTIKRQPIH